VTAITKAEDSSHVVNYRQAIWDRIIRESSEESKKVFIPDPAGRRWLFKYSPKLSGKQILITE
jgi:hypothetical protein